MPSKADGAPRLGDKSAAVIFVVTLFSFVVESQFTEVCYPVQNATILTDFLGQYVQTELNYHHPYFLL